MQGAVRPYVTAGVALVGASVIAVSPVAPPVPDIKVAAAPSVSTAMQLASATNPLLAFSELFSNTLTNASGLFEQFVASPAPILFQVVANQGANVGLIIETAEQIGGLLPDLVTQIGTNLREVALQIAAGDFVGAGETLNETLIYVGLPLLGLIGPPLSILQNTTQNIANIYAELPNQVFPLLSALVLSPVNSIINGTADIAQTIFDAATAGDFLAAAGAVISAPIVMADVVLNGFAGVPGLLTPKLNPFTAGPIGALLGLRDVIADQLEPIALPGMALAANQAPDVDAEVFTLSVDAGAKAAEGVGASSVEGDDGLSALAATGGTDGSGVAGALDEEGEAEDGAAEELEAEEGADVDGSAEDDDTEPAAEGADESEEGSGAGEVRESLKATPGEAGLNSGGDAGEGGAASDEGQAPSAAGDADDSDTDGDAAGDAGGSEAGSGGDE